MLDRIVMFAPLFFMPLKGHDLEAVLRSANRTDNAASRGDRDMSRSWA